MLSGENLSKPPMATEEAGSKVDVLTVERLTWNQRDWEAC